VKQTALTKVNERQQTRDSAGTLSVETTYLWATYLPIVSHDTQNNHIYVSVSIQIDSVQVRDVFHF
jgi:hypothetical protein